MILNGGGLRGLVATAVLLDQAPRAMPELLHVVDGRDAAPLRREYLQRQADHFALREVRELERPYLYGSPTARQPDGLPHAALATPRLLLEALAVARQRRAEQLVWPISVDAQTDPLAEAQERQILVQQLSDLEVAGQNEAGEASTGQGNGSCELTVPLLGYSDAQLIQLGQGLGVPWEIAWSCLLNASQQCGSCPACRRRRRAFEAAGVIDPVFAVGRRR